jgi:hypothetical protein
MRKKKNRMLTFKHDRQPVQTDKKRLKLVMSAIQPAMQRVKPAMQRVKLNMQILSNNKLKLSKKIIVDTLGQIDCWIKLNSQ